MPLTRVDTQLLSNGFTTDSSGLNTINNGNTKILATAAGTNRTLIFQNEVGTQATLGIGTTGGTGGINNFYLQTNAGVTLTANASGELGLGTTPTSGYRLTTSGTTAQYASTGTQVPFVMKSGAVTGPGSTFYTVHTFGEYASTAFMLMVSYENNAGDGANLSAIFVDNGSNSYGGGFGATRLTGSTSLECSRGGTTGARTLQVRHSSGSGAGDTYLQWQLFLLASTST
jgi:hypothetical protein